MKTKNWILGAVILYAGYNLASKEPEPPAPVFPEGTILTIQLRSARVIDANGIGNEWSFQSQTGSGNTITHKGIQVDVSGLSFYTIESIAIENDPSHDDIGDSFLRLDPTNLNNMADYTEQVSVYERYGSGAGNTALCEFRYHIEVDTLWGNR